MRILLIGFLAFTAWSSFATYIYVCKIKGLCNEPVLAQNMVIAAPDTTATLIAPELAVKPENMATYFEFDKSDFTANSNTEQLFNKFSIYMNQNLQRKILITGHTDNVGTHKYNLALGLRRAKTMQQYFISKGMQPNKIKIISEGENTPTDNNNTDAGRANNRRTIITIN